MGRLVVAAHLPHHGLAVLVVMPEGVVAPWGFHVGREYADVVVGRAHDHFLAPVAEHIALVAGRSLGVVVGHGAFKDGYLAGLGLHDVAGSVLAVAIVERFLAEVAIPINAHILRNVEITLVEALDCGMGHGSDEVGVGCRYTHSPGYVADELAHHGAAVIACAQRTVVNLGCGGIAVVVVRLALVAGKDFLAEGVWVEIAAVLRIAVAKAAGGKALAVVVDDHGTKHNLVASVPVNVGYAIVVVSLAVP